MGEKAIKAVPGAQWDGIAVNRKRKLVDVQNDEVIGEADLRRSDVFIARDPAGFQSYRPEFRQKSSPEILFGE